MQMNRIKLFGLVAVFSLVSLNDCDSAKILTIIPFPMKSHDIVYKPLLLELARRGHNITAIGPYPTSKNIFDEKIKQNYREVIYQSNYKEIFKTMDFFEFKSQARLIRTDWWDLFDFWNIMYHVSEDMYESPGVKEIIESSKEEKYDLIISEGFFTFESTFAFGALFQAPVIAVATFGTTVYMNQHIGNPIETSYYPNFILPYTDNMNFVQRLNNFLLNSYVIICTHLFHIPAQEQLIRKYFNDAIKPRIKMPKLTDMLADTSLVFINTHIVLGMPRPNLPNIVEIGGLHIQPLTNDTMDKSLQKLLDDAREGVVYFSLGTNVNITKMPNNYVRAFVEVFSSIPQLVLWKVEDTSLTGLSNNVHIKNWFPQQQILAHKHCVAFITHGGMLSLEEAVYNAVPVIGIPFFGDQMMNMKRVEEINFGIYLEYHNITYDSLKWSLNQIISNRKYKETARKLSSIFNDNNGGTPLEKAVYWVEYVLRYNGAPHLRTAARYLSWYKYLLLDVCIAIILVIVILFYIIYSLLKLFFSLFVGHQIEKKKND